MERQAGYYWVKDCEGWYIAEWNAEYLHWEIHGTDNTFCDDEWSEINEDRIIAPDEIEKYGDPEQN